VTTSAGQGGGAERFGKMSSMATAHMPKTNPSAVHSRFEYPLLWAKRRHNTASQVWTTRAVRTSVAGSICGSIQRSPVKWPNATSQDTVVYPAGRVL